MVLGNNCIFGYRKDRGRLVVCEDEAAMVIDLFTKKQKFLPPEEVRMRLTVKIFTWETAEKYLDTLRRRSSAPAEREPTLAGCTGHTFKKMIEAYENGMK